MELDDLKNIWENVNDHVNEAQNLTPKIIDQMTQAEYRSNLKKVIYPELTGIVICLMGASFIWLNFYKLGTPFLHGAGIVSILLLLTVSIISLLSLKRFKITGDMNKPYAETLQEFAVQKIQFYKLQKVNITLSYLLLVTVIILLPELFSGKGPAGNAYFWTFSFTFGYLFLLFCSRRVFRFYNKIIRQAEELLKESQA